MNAKVTSGKCGRTEDKNYSYKQDPVKEQKQYSKSTKNERIFSCPSCKQKIRVVLPLPSNKGKCSSCQNTFKVSSDESGNIYIYGAYKNQSTYDATLTVEDSFKVLEINQSSTHSEIKRAYKIKMKEYHPDKVASLGDKLKDIATKETKQINAAFNVLQKNGYC